MNEKFAQWHSYYDAQHDLCICLLYNFFILFLILVYSIHLFFTIIFINIITILSIVVSLPLLFQNMSGVIKQHGVQKLVKVARSHSFKNGLKSTQPRIQLLTCLGIKGPL